MAAETRVDWYDEVNKINEEAKKLKAAGVQVIIALGHSGYHVDQVIARDCPEVDIVVGGHSHTFLYSGTPPDLEKPKGPYPTIVRKPSGRLVPVVQASAFSKYLGKFDVELDSKGNVVNASGSPILLDNTYAEDQEVLSRLDNWRLGLANISKEEIITSRVFLNGTCRFNECNLGNLITDAFVEYGVKHSLDKNWTDAAIALYSGGGVRASIDSTDKVVRGEDVITTLPFYNGLVLISLLGRYLLEALEWSVERYDTTYTIGRGEFLQVSGLQVEYDLSRPNGSKVVSALALCSHCRVPVYSPVDKDATYNMVVNAYLAFGGDSYGMVDKHKTLLKTYEALDTDVVLEYLKLKSLMGDLHTEVEGRIKFVSSSSRSTKNGRSGATSVGTPSLLFTLIIVLSFMKVT